MASELLTKNIKAIRMAMGVSQEEISALLEIPRTTYAYYESGKAEPGLSSMARLSKITGQPLETLLERDLSAIPKDELAKTIITSIARLAASK